MKSLESAPDFYRTENAVTVSLVQHLKKEYDGRRAKNKKASEACFKSLKQSLGEGIQQLLNESFNEDQNTVMKINKIFEANGKAKADKSKDFRSFLKAQKATA